MPHGRTTRLAAVAAGAIVGAALWMPAVAHADGGAYIELNHTYYLPGDTALAKAYVSIPEAQQGILDRGPFDAYLLPKGVFGLREDRPIPEGTIRLGSLDIEREHGVFELRVRFVVPEVPSGTHYIATCNDPCTVAGFKEPLIGSMGVVATAREAQLLRENGRLQGRTYGLQRNVRRAAKKTHELQIQLRASEAVRSSLSSALSDLQARLAEADASIAREATSPRTPWWEPALMAMAVLALVGALFFGRRGHRRPVEVVTEA